MPTSLPGPLPPGEDETSARAPDEGARTALDSAALDTLFREARTLGKWTDAGVSDETLRELYELVKLGPTSGNGSPGRFVFVRTKEGKEKLRPALSAGNRRKDDGGPGDGDRRL